MRIEEIIQAHAESRRQRVPALKPTTLAFDQRGYSFLRGIGSGLDDMTPRRAEQVRKEWFDTGMATRTLNKSTGCARSVLKWAVRMEMIQGHPLPFSLAVPRVEERERPRDAFVIEEWREARKVADERLDMLDLYLCSGCRRNELRLLGWEEVDFENRCFHLPASRTKMHRARDCLLGPRMAKRLAGRKRVSKWVFPGGGEDGAMGPSNINNYIKTLCEQIGRSPRGMTTHSLRYTTTGFLADIKTGPREIHLILGQKTGDVMLDTYMVRHSNTMLRETAEALENYAFS